MNAFRRWIIGLAVCAASLASGTADTVYVTSPLTRTEDPNAAANAYSNWTYAATNLQAAIDMAKAQAWPNVVVSNGFYGLTGTISVTHGAVLRSCNAVGATDPAGTVLDGGGAVQCLVLNHADCVVDGFTITGGHAAVSGGGLSIGKALLVTNCIVVGNTADGGTSTSISPPTGGGGIYVNYDTGSVTLSDLLVSNNTAAIDAYATDFKGGGGVLILSTNVVVLSNCTIASNNSQKTYGGGVTASYYNRTMNVRLYDCTICGNVNTKRGGGVALPPNVKGTIYLERCVVSNNTSTGDGGGLYNCVASNCTIIANSAGSGNYHGGGSIGGTVYDSRVIGNYAGTRGGGVYQATVYRSLLSGNTGGTGAGCSDSTLYECLVVSNVGYGTYYSGLAGMLRLSGCTVAYNTGNGLYIQDPGTSNNVWGTNSIICSNSAYDVYFRSANSYVYTNAFGYCCVGVSSRELAPGLGNISENPEWVNPDTCEFRLNPGSPCVNAGTNLAWMREPGATDKAGQSRIDRFSGRVDIGAYELHPSGTLLNLR